MNFKELVEQLTKNPFLIELGTGYRDNIDLSGFVLRKPRFYKSDKRGIESCSFFLYQIVPTSKGLRVESFSCITYVKSLVDQFKDLKNVIFIATVGKFKHSYKINNNYSQVVEIETIAEFEEQLVD